MAWNDMNQSNVKKPFDSFWLGFIPSFLISSSLIIFLFKYKYVTSQPIFEALWRLANKGFLGNDLLASILPGFMLIFIFTKLKKEKATVGAFIGMAPFIILTFWFS